MGEDLDLLAALEQDILDDAPIAPTLRRCVLLGGRANSAELRDWATQELNGYQNEEEVPDYRRIPAAIVIDQIVGRTWAKGLVISPSVIPEFAREMFAAGPVIYAGVGTVEQMARDAGTNGMTMTHAYAQDVAATMDRNSGNPFQQTHALYWKITRASLYEIVEQVKTTLAQMVAEMRTQTPVGQALPSSEVVSEAVRKVLEGSARKSRG